MSYFLCLSASGQFPQVTDPPVEVRDISDTPFGRVTAGNKQKAKAYLLTIQGHSTWLLNKGPKRKRFASTVVDVVRLLLRDSPSVALVIHFCRDTIEREEVVLLAKVIVPFDEFANRFPNYKEDTRYVVIPTSSPSLRR